MKRKLLGMGVMLLILVMSLGMGARAGTPPHLCPLPAHNFSVPIAQVEPTCAQAGSTEGWRCSSCDATQFVEPIPALPHTVVIDPGTAATCTQTGLTQGSHCAVCNAPLTARRTIPAHGHRLVPIPAVRATCTTLGSREGSRCTVCNDTFPGAVIRYKSHWYGPWTSNGDGTHSAVCRNRGCDAKKTVACQYVEAVLDGHLMRICPVCGNTTIVLDIDPDEGGPSVDDRSGPADGDKDKGGTGDNTVSGDISPSVGGSAGQDDKTPGKVGPSVDDRSGPADGDKDKGGTGDNTASGDISPNVGGSAGPDGGDKGTGVPNVGAAQGLMNAGSGTVDTGNNLLAAGPQSGPDPNTGKDNEALQNMLLNLGIRHPANGAAFLPIQGATAFALDKKPLPYGEFVALGMNDPFRGEALSMPGLTEKKAVVLTAMTVGTEVAGSTHHSGNRVRVTLFGYMESLLNQMRDTPVLEGEGDQSPENTTAADKGQPGANPLTSSIGQSGGNLPVPGSGQMVNSPSSMIVAPSGHDHHEPELGQAAEIPTAPVIGKPGANPLVLEIGQLVSILRASEGGQWLPVPSKFENGTLSFETVLPGLFVVIVPVTPEAQEQSLQQDPGSVPIELFPQGPGIVPINPPPLDQSGPQGLLESQVPDSEPINPLPQVPGSEPIGPQSQVPDSEPILPLTQDSDGAQGFFGSGEPGGKLESPGR